MIRQLARWIGSLAGIKPAGDRRSPGRNRMDRIRAARKRQRQAKRRGR